MGQFDQTVLAVLAIGWGIACFIFYHKVFTVYYFSLSRGLMQEILWCGFFGVILAGLTLKFSTPLAICLIIVGWSLTRNIDSSALRNICFTLFVVVAVIIFFSGRKFQKLLEESTAKSSEIVIHEKEQIQTAPTNVPTIYMPEVPLETEVFAVVETEAPVYIPEETYRNNGITSENKTITEHIATEPPSSTVTGYVIESSGGLKIRSGPGTSYLEVGRLAPNEQVTIYDQKYGESYMWGRIDRGWVCMDYITIGTAPNYTEVYKVGYIVGSEEGVNIRSGPAVSYDQIGRAYLGQQVVVTKTYHNGVSEWGYIGDGWICTDYIHFGDIPPGTDYYGNSDPSGASVSEWDKGEPLFVGYDCYGNELRVGYYVCIGARQGSHEFAVGTITGLQENGIPVVEFTELYNYEYPEEIMYCVTDLADKINSFGSYCCEVKAQHLQIYYWG